MTRIGAASCNYGLHLPHRCLPSVPQYTSIEGLVEAGPIQLIGLVTLQRLERDFSPSSNAVAQVARIPYDRPSVDQSQEYFSALLGWTGRRTDAPILTVSKSGNAS